ncbi:DUF2142 domain-containing protein [Methylobacterium sp. NEAU 140]|uniref:DUF2142 domain-containing protein n=1 Tax=Methylobacterium sp. NEAU 140 TaxID=3064945 RepID=UPI00273250B7|nr:DUF2142 domain-containing protein [Methylobacterium sp. NEAU 140]MDP4023391.1 DUF2142 domain-containing protein [Methylobacterium sp. NEAU 140]
MRIPAPGGPRFWCGAFLALCLPVCLALALIVPLGEVADEAAHLARAAALSEGQLVGHRETVTYADGSTHVAAGMRIDPVWIRAGRSRPPDVRGTLAPIEAEPGPDGRVFMPLYTVATYPPLLYAPGAAGLLAGRALGLAPEGAARLGRLANAAAYLALGVAALALATRGRAALFALLALPMPLSLAASLSQDALVVALAALAAALLTPRPQVGRGGYRRLWAAAGALALVVLAKPPYAPLAAMLLVPLPPRSAIGRFLLRRGPLVALAVAPAALWTLAATALVATPVPRPAYEAGPLWPGPRPATFSATDPGAQARVLLAEPARLLTVPAKYLFGLKHLIALAREAIGSFGWADRPLPAPLYALWAAALLVPWLADRRGPLPPGPERAGLAACAVLCLWLVILSQYLSWTDVGTDRVDGPQGRYLLPLAPMLILALARGRIGTAAVGRWPALLPVAAAAVDVVALPLVAWGAAPG